jgi:hypothetical protein
VPEGIKGNIFAVSEGESDIFFVCYQLSWFLWAAGAHKGGKSVELCQAIIFITIFLIVL